MDLLGPDEYLTSSAKMGLDLCSGIYQAHTFDDFNEKLHSQVYAVTDSKGETISADAYDDKLVYMQAAGYTDDTLSRRALHAKAGNINAAIEMLKNSGGLF